jgi:hypothetical protein
VFDALITTDQSLRYQQTSLAADVRFFVLATTSWLRVRNRFAASNRWPIRPFPNWLPGDNDVPGHVVLPNQVACTVNADWVRFQSVAVTCFELRRVEGAATVFHACQAVGASFREAFRAERASPLSLPR